MVVTSVLKISFAGEIRRLRVSLPDFHALGAPAWLQALKDIVSQTLGTDSTAGAEDALTLLYKDKDGELSVLGDESAASFLALSASGGAGPVLRLFVEKAGAKHCRQLGETSRKSARVAVPPAQAIQSSSSSQSQLLWTSDDGKASVSFVDSRLYGRQPRLLLGKHSFYIHIKLGDDREESPFDGSSSHRAALSASHLALRELVPSLLRTPGWHRVALEDGCSIALRQCLEQQLHLCSKHSRH
jgi:hypothetical protein